MRQPAIKISIFLSSEIRGETGRGKASHHNNEQRRRIENAASASAFVLLFLENLAVENSSIFIFHENLFVF